MFTADVTYIRRPAWLTGSDLGTHRANNYLTVPLALYNKSEVLFRLDATNQEVFDKFIDVRVSRMKLLAFLMPVYILTESNDLEISQLPAYFHANEFTKNTITIPGTFNVGKWPRPLDFSFCLLDKIEIKEGDPLYYIKFNTKEPINFKRFIVSDLYKKYIFNFLISTRNLKRTNYSKLNYFYNIFRICYFWILFNIDRVGRMLNNSNL